jgi:dTDP-glucose pyrophosphorylase
VNERFRDDGSAREAAAGRADQPWYNAGIYMFRSSIFDFTAKLQRSPRGEFELTDAIRDLALSGKRCRRWS